MTPRRASQILSVLAAGAVLLPSAAWTAPLGPTYPLPGGPGVGHGGSTCLAGSDAEAAAGKDATDNGAGEFAGQMWHYGAGTDPAQAGCAFSTTPTDLEPFDTSRFERLFWGVTSTPALSLNADGDTSDPGEVMTLDPDSSDLAAGRLVWTGTTSMTWCQPQSCATYTETPAVPTRFVVTATDLAGDPVALLDPESVEVPSSVGGLVEVTPELANFKVNVVMLADDPSTESLDLKPAISMYNDLNHPPQEAPQTQMSFGGGFYFLSRPPTGSIEGPAAPEAGSEVSYTAAVIDPDGSPGDPLSFAWDLDGDGQFDDSATQSVQVTYPVGEHDLAVVVTDADGASETFNRTITAVDTTAPVVSVTLDATKLRAVISKGLGGSLTADEATTAKLKATLAKRVAKRLGLKNPIAKGQAVTTGSGTVDFSMQLTRAAKAKLKTLPKARVTVKAVVLDSAGNRATTKTARTYR